MKVTRTEHQRAYMFHKVNPISPSQGYVTIKMHCVLSFILILCLLENV